MELNAKKVIDKFFFFSMFLFILIFPIVESTLNVQLQWKYFMEKKPVNVMRTVILVIP